MNDLQLKIDKEMVGRTDLYLGEKISFHKLVSDLKGSFLAAEIREEKLIKEWFDFWTPLEIFNAVSLSDNKDIDKNEVLPSVEKMKAYLLKTLLAC